MEEVKKSVPASRNDMPITDEKRQRFVGKLLELPLMDKIHLGMFYGNASEMADGKASFIIAEALAAAGIPLDFGSDIFRAAFFVATYVGKSRISFSNEEKAESVIGEYAAEWDDNDYRKREIRMLFDSMVDATFARILSSLLLPAANDGRALDLASLMCDIEHWEIKSRRVKEVHRRWIDELAGR